MNVSLMFIFSGSFQLKTGLFSRQTCQVTSHPKSPRTTGNEAAGFLNKAGLS